MSKTVLYVIIALAVVWFVHVHYNRGVPVKTK